MDPDLPESQEVYRVVVRVFVRQLAVRLTPLPPVEIGTRRRC